MAKADVESWDLGLGAQGSDRLNNSVTRQYSQITPRFHPTGRTSGRWSLWAWV